MSTKQLSTPIIPTSKSIRIGKYKKTRYWGVWLDDQLLAVTVYKKGALAIKNILGKELHSI